MDLKGLNDEQIVELIKAGKAGLADVVDSGICPTCFNKKNNGVLYGNR